MNLKQYQNLVRPDFLLEVAMGKHKGFTFIEKFGENPEITTGTDPEDVWSGGGVYNFSSTADIDTVSSSNAGDSSTVTVIGLDSDWNEVTQQVTLNGQTRVALTTPLIRVYRAYNDNGTPFAGDVYVSVDGTLTGGVPTTANMRAKVTAAAQQTEMAIYSVPSGYTAFFLGGYVACSRRFSAIADFVWQARTFGGVFRVQSRIAVNSTGAGAWQYKYPIPVSLPEKSDIKIQCKEVSATVGVSGGFSILLVDNNYL